MNISINFYNILIKMNPELIIPNPALDSVRKDLPTFMSKDKYIISDELAFFLRNPNTYLTPEKIKKDDKSLYLVCFRKVKNNNEDIIVYSYIKYHPLFYDLWFNFLLSDRTSDNTTNEMGDLLYLINRDIYDNFSKSNKYLTEFSDEFDRINNRRISHNLNVNGTNDYKDVLTTMHKFNMYCSNDDIINLLSLGFNNENFDFVKQVYTIQNPNIKWEINNKSDCNKKNNILNGCILLTNDLNSMIKKFQSKGFKINGGPQRFRNQTNSGSFTLDMLDIDFRNASFYHGVYHYCYKGWLSQDRFLTRDKFSFKNIHIKCGYVRW